MPASKDRREGHRRPKAPKKVDSGTYLKKISSTQEIDRVYTDVRKREINRVYTDVRKRDKRERVYTDVRKRTLTDTQSLHRCAETCRLKSPQSSEVRVAKSPQM